MIAIRLGLVIMLFTLDVHQIQFIDQAVLLEQRDGSIDCCAVDSRILLPGNLEEPGRIEMPG